MVVPVLPLWSLFVQFIKCMVVPLLTLWSPFVVIYYNDGCHLIAPFLLNFVTRKYLYGMPAPEGLLHIHV